MGNYNPHLPEILGMEFAPFHADDRRVLDIGTEIGYSFTVTGAPNNELGTVNLISQPPAQSMNGSTLFYSIYPQGREDDTGTIHVIRLSPLSVFASGASVVGGGTSIQAIELAGDTRYLQFDATTDQIRIRMDTIPTELQGKRILGIDFVYQAFGTPGFSLYPTIEAPNVVYPYGTFSGPANLAEAQESTLSFGEVNPWWAILGGVGPNTNSDRYPFRYDELTALTSSPGGLFIGVKVDTLPLSGNGNLGFMALDVYYCEESRVRYGGKAIGQDSTGNLTLDSPDGNNTVTLRTASFAASGTTAAGVYTVTVTQADGGDLYNASGLTAPQVTQLYEIPSHPGVMVRKFRRPSGGLPAINPSAEPTDDIVACSLLDYAASNSLQFGEASVTYVDVIAPEVYVDPTGTSVTAVQEIHNEADPANTSYEWVRFYARRANPTAPGDLTVTVAGSGSATITPEEFAALDEITVDVNGVGMGWREVTLAIAAVFSSDASFRDVTFEMTGVSTGTIFDSWQILGTRITFPPDYPTGNGYGKSSYDGLQQGTLTWKAPNGIQTQAGSTAVVMFSQAAPEVTGLAVTSQTLALEGIAEHCDMVPGCIPTGVNYLHLSCVSTGVTGSYIEVERRDDFTDWALVASVPVTGTTVEFAFNDFEARVGQESEYRVRRCNVLDFCGPWVTGAGTLTSPGITGAEDGNSVLIFTSNAVTGSSLAYIMQFESDPVEEFGFPEAGFTQMRTQYQKNFFTAFRPTERGGETFTRDVLVHAAAIPPVSMANFASLRDLAWDTLPYVCVRDELGNRWFANVQVPSGRVRRDRSVYIAQIVITEVTDTPAPYTGG